jgi:hypothetical protein
MYDSNGNTSVYCSISGQNIGTTGMGHTDVLSTNVAVLTSIIISVIQMFCPLMKQFSLVLPFLLY